MPSYFALVPVFFPIIAGILHFSLPFRTKKQRNIYTELVVTAASVFVLAAVLFSGREMITLFYFTKELSLSFRIDKLSCVFAVLVSLLWPLATLYSFEYMRNEERAASFAAFFVMTFGVTVGIAFAGNLLTMYIFYEMLTLVTFPLVLHPMTDEARKVSGTYLVYSLGGAAFAFVGIIFVLYYCGTLDFAIGGVLTESVFNKRENLFLLFFVVSFCGFSVKAAMFPFSRWLVKAYVAPTPVTALLHAVAVVKAGAFATMRLTYYVFGTDCLRGTWAQYTVMGLSLVTIIYGSTMAVKEQHFKRRLAYSTVSNLSYILFGVTMMTPLGLVAALSHMVFHAVMKICSFFCAGIVMHQTGKNYVYELNGIGRRMKVTFTCFTVAALALTGIPPLAGFMSKWNLATAAVDSENILAFVGVGVLLYSAFMTAIYMIGISVQAFFPKDNVLCDNFNEISEPSIEMLLPITVFAICILVIGLLEAPLLDYFGSIFL